MTLRRSATAASSSPSSRRSSSATRSRCARSSDSRSCGAWRISSTSSAPTWSRSSERRRRASSVWRSAARRRPSPNSALSSNSEFDHAGPRPSASTVHGVVGQVAAVDRRAAGRVGDRQPVAEQLREQLEVRGLAAAGARARELEQRLQELRAAHRAEVDARAVVGRQLLEERDVLALGGHQRLARVEVDRLAHGVAARRDRAGLDAQPAAGAVLDVHLQRVPGLRQAGCVERCRAEALGSPVQLRRLVVARADHAVRADEAAVAALDAQLGVPDRDQVRDVALLVLRRAARIRAVDRQRADRQLVAAAGHHRRGHRAHELGRVLGDDRPRARGSRSRRSGSSTLCSPSSARSTAARLRSTTSAPRRP